MHRHREKPAEAPGERLVRCRAAGKACPARVVDLNILSTDDKAQNECTVTVPDDQLSLAIGVKGQNVKLASRLTGWKLNLRPESGFYGEE